MSRYYTQTAQYRKHQQTDVVSIPTSTTTSTNAASRSNNNHNNINTPASNGNAGSLASNVIINNNTNNTNNNNNNNNVKAVTITGAMVNGKQQYYQLIKAGSGTQQSQMTTATPIIRNGNGTTNVAIRGGSASAGALSLPPGITKISTHLLDHGYGATPQPQQFTASGAPVVSRESMGKEAAATTIATTMSSTANGGVAATAAATTTTATAISTTNGAGAAKSLMMAGQNAATVASNGGTKSSDNCITHFYKAVKRRLNMTPIPANMSPTPPKQAKQQQQQVRAVTPPATPNNSVSKSASKKRYSEGTRFVLKKKKTQLFLILKY